MKTLYKPLAIGLALVSLAAIITGSFILKSAVVEDAGIIGFILSPFLKGLGDK